MHEHGAAVENEVREGRIPERAGGDIDQSEEQAHGENAHEFEGRKVDGSENESLKEYGAPSFLKTLRGQGGDESAEDIFLKQGGHEGQDEQADKEFWRVSMSSIASKMA